MPSAQCAHILSYGLGLVCMARFPQNWGVFDIICKILYVQKLDGDEGWGAEVLMRFSKGETKKSEQLLLACELKHYISWPQTTDSTYRPQCQCWKRH